MKTKLFLLLVLTLFSLQNCEEENFLPTDLTPALSAERDANLKTLRFAVSSGGSKTWFPGPDRSIIYEVSTRSGAILDSAPLPSPSNGCVLSPYESYLTTTHPDGQVILLPVPFDLLGVVILDPVPPTPETPRLPTFNPNSTELSVLDVALFKKHQFSVQD